MIRLVDKYKTLCLPLLIVVWALVQTVLWIQHGIYTGGEGLRIIREANLVHTGQPFTSHIYYTYLTEILLSNIALYLNGNFIINYVVHLLVNLTALLCFYHLIKDRTNETIALGASVMLALCFPYQIYNNFVYTESLFFSLSIFYLFLLFNQGKRSGGRLALIFLVLFLLCITRPSGIFFVFATISYGFFKAQQLALWLRLSLMIIPAVIFGFLTHYGIEHGEGIQVMEPFLREHIICDLPQQTAPLSLELNEQGNTLKGLIYYVTNNPWHFLTLAAQKTVAFFGLYRPWYSAMHNLLLCLYFYSLFAAILYLIFKNRISTLLLFTIQLTFVFWLFVIFTCDEWHNRFFLTLTPFLIASATDLFKNTPTKKLSVE